MESPAPASRCRPPVGKKLPQRLCDAVWRIDCILSITRKSAARYAAINCARPLARFPSPRRGEGGEQGEPGEGRSDYRESESPSPQPSPLRGEGAPTHCARHPLDQHAHSPVDGRPCPLSHPTRTPMPAKQKPPRLPSIPAEALSERQKQLMEAIRTGPRGRVSQGGPFGVYLHAPEFGDLVQRLGAHCRYKTGVAPRLSESAILCTARQWRAQYEWHAHAAIAEKAGVAPETIRDVKAGRAPKKAPKDERAIYDFVAELYKTRRVSERTYKRVQAILGDATTVELVGILGYYATVAMMLDV